LPPTQPLPTRTTAAVLSVDPEVFRFRMYRGDTEQDLRDALQRQRSTRKVPITRRQELQLRQDGRTGGGYRFTHTGMTQLCRLLAPNLSSVLFNLAGMRRRTDTREEYSVQLAIQTLNSLIDLRFSLLAHRYHLILDSSNERIEGVVGPRYHFISNLDTYQRVTTFLTTKCPTVPTLYEAALSGRRLQLRYQNPASSFAIRGDSGKLDTFCGGWHVVNSELGDCCFRGSVLLVHQQSFAAALVPYAAEAKLIHLQNSGFDARFNSVLRHVQARLSRITNVRGHLQQATQTPLKVPDKPRPAQQLEQLALTLRRYGVGKRAALDALLQAVMPNLSQGPGRAQRSVRAAGVSYRELQNCRRYALFLALCQVARRLSLGNQEAAEMAAYRLITNEIPV
jgi:hypothetical protein